MRTLFGRNLGRRAAVLTGLIGVGDLGFAVLETTVALLAAALPTLAAGFAAAAFAVVAVAVFTRFAGLTRLTRLAVAVGLALGAFSLTASLFLDAALLGLLGGDDGRRLGARLVLEVDVEALAR